MESTKEQHRSSGLQQRQRYVTRKSCFTPPSNLPNPWSFVNDIIFIIQIMRTVLNESRGKLAIKRTYKARTRARVCWLPAKNTENTYITPLLSSIKNSLENETGLKCNYALSTHKTSNPLQQLFGVWYWRHSPAGYTSMWRILILIYDKITFISRLQNSLFIKASICQNMY